MADMSRREFLLRSTAAGVAGAATLALPKAAMAVESRAGGTLGTFIDLTKCVGCDACVDACTLKNESRYPEPVDDIPVNWPTGKYEDWSDKRDLKDRLTP
ncbi:MAG TPA: 4Fe-4S binding protein, partial [Coriobacteriia bacterium]|nr:4Fe-4S binding protein [Coriobacteriia bacterium]